MKNQIIQYYLEDKISIVEVINQFDSLQQKKNKDGVIYTPWHIVQYMIELVEPTIKDNIIEPACGHGIFIIGLLEYMRNKHGLKGNDLYKWFREKVIANDINKQSIEELQKIITAYFLKNDNLNINSNEKWDNLINSDALFNNIIDNKTIDICISNPPYIRTKHLEHHYLQKIKTNFSSCKKGNIDLYYAFMEKFSKVKKSCFITPNSFITNLSANTLRNIITPNLSVLIDFKHKKIFENAMTYCAITLLQKNVVPTCQYANDLEKPLLMMNKDELLNQKEKNQMSSSHKLIKNSPYNNVLSSIATLADEVFLVEKTKNGQQFFTIYNNETYYIEKEMVIPYLKLTKQKDNDFSNIMYMIYPYDKNKKALEEKVIKEKYPLTYHYLVERKERLFQRDSGKGKYEQWYAYGRKQGLYDYNIEDSSMLLIPRLIGENCKPYIIDLGSLLNEFQQIVFTSGFLVPQTKDNKEETLKLLSKEFIDYIKEHGKPWPGKKEPYYSVTAKQIKQFEYKKIKSS